MKVSVLINNYNYGRFVKECLDSLSNQTVKADEVIFYDDGSTDESIAVVSQYPFVQIISRPNHGQKPAFNQGNAINIAFQESTGNIICLLDSDDFFEPTKIEKIKNAFAENPDAVLIQHAYNEYVNGKITRKVDYSLKNKCYKNLYAEKKWANFFNPTSTMSFSRNYLQKILPITNDGQWRVWPDVRLSRIAPYYGKIVCLSDALSHYRRHQNNDSTFMNQNHKATLANQIAHHNYLNKQLIHLGLSPINYKQSWNYFKFRMKALLFG